MRIFALTAFMLSSSVFAASLFSRDPRKDVVHSLAKRAIGPLCFADWGELSFDDCMATWNHLPSVRGEVRFAAESAGVFGAARVKLPYLERPRNVPTAPTSKLID